MSLPSISVVICCHNSALRLPETLRHLTAQKIGTEVLWEVLIIDNASTDDTAVVAQKHWTGSGVPLRVVQEKQPGLCHARVCGARTAKYEIISFIDDDNWVEADWIQKVAVFFGTHPEYSVLGGKSEGVYESEPPDWFDGVKGFYALGAQHSFSREVTHAPGTLLWGAGLTLRRSSFVFLLNNGFEFLSTGRKGGRLSTGEDSELCFALRATGCRLWYDDHLSLRHFMPSNRLTWGYALRLMSGMGESSVLLNLYLTAFNEEGFRNLPGYKKIWLFQFLKTLKNTARILLSTPSDCFFKPEGSRHGLDFQMLLGSLCALCALCGRYKSRIKKIQTAPWNSCAAINDSGDIG